jgi:hypothetical protein
MNYRDGRTLEMGAIWTGNLEENGFRVNLKPKAPPDLISTFDLYLPLGG